MMDFIQNQNQESPMPRNDENEERQAPEIILDNDEVQSEYGGQFGEQANQNEEEKRDEEKE